MAFVSIPVVPSCLITSDVFACQKLAELALALRELDVALKLSPSGLQPLEATETPEPPGQ